MIERPCHCFGCNLRRFIVAAILIVSALFVLRHWGDNPHPLAVEHLEAKGAWLPTQQTFAPQSQLWPPDEFKSNGAAIVLFTDKAGIDKACGAPPAGLIRLGCEGPLSDGTPMIAIANPCLFPPDDFFAGLMCHELGHRNGWRHPQ